MTATAAPRFVSRAPKLGFVASFDGIRGVGIVMVLIAHALFGYFESWATTVDTFFVMSGFLIVTLLLQESRSTGSISFRKFYTRRAIRLLPSVLLFVGVWLVVGVIGEIAGIEAIKLSEISKDVLAAVGYVYHVVFPNGLSMLEPDVQDQRTMWHFWSLSVEEHFYFIIPALVYFCIRRGWVALLGWVMGLGAVAIGVARFAGFTGPDMSDGAAAGIRLAFLQRPDVLMLGVALAVFNAHLDEERAARLRKPALILGHVGFVVWFAMVNLSSGFVEKVGNKLGIGLPYFQYLPDNRADATRQAIFDHEPWYWVRFGHSVGAFAFAAMFFAMYRYPGWWLERIMTIKPFRWLGRMAYTIYIWHALPYLLLLALTGGDDVSTTVKILRTPVLIASAFVVAIPVFYKVEMRVMGMKLRFASEKEALDLRTGKMIDVEQELAKGTEDTGRREEGS